MVLEREGTVERSVTPQPARETIAAVIAAGGDGEAKEKPRPTLKRQSFSLPEQEAPQLSVDVTVPSQRLSVSHSPHPSPAASPSLGRRRIAFSRGQSHSGQWPQPAREGQLGRAVVCGMCCLLPSPVRCPSL